jgi:hypothetical protein
MIAGQSYPISIIMRNTGLTAWTAVAGYKLGSQNPPDNTLWGVAQVAVPAFTPPCMLTIFNFTATAPTVPGTYIFQWRMLQQGVEQFGDLTPLTRVRVVTSQPSVRINGETQFETKRGEFVSADYTITQQVLQAPLTVRWTANGFVTDPTGLITQIEFNPGPLAGVTVQRMVSVEVTDASGVRVQDSKTVSIKIAPLPAACRSKPWLPECKP